VTGTQIRVRVADEQYALPVEHVLEIAELGDIAAVPGARETALGVRNVRGRLLPVFDLAPLLSLSRESPPSRLLIAEAGPHTAGFAVDEVCDVGLLDGKSQEAEHGLLAGSVLVEDGLVGLIDVPRLFAELEREGP
jgi:purine-binding chemotaxis protein CheW